MKRLLPVTGPCLAIVLCLLLPSTLLAAAGKVVIAAGDAFAVDAQNQRRELQRRADVFEGDTLITGDDGQLQLRFEDNAILALRANSELRISEYHGATEERGERVLMELVSGGFRTISGHFGKSERDAYQVRTPNASIGIRGTHYEAVFQSDTLTVGVYDGGVSVRNDFGELNLGRDSNFLFAEVAANNTPRGLLNPPDILNIPSTRLRPQNNGNSDSENNDETDGSENTEDDDGELSDADVESTDSPTNPEPDALVTNPDEFTINTLENVLNDSAEQLRGDPRLTDAEEQALASSDQTGFLVFAAGSFNDSANTSDDDSFATLNVLFSYAAAVSGGNTFYGIFSDEAEEVLLPLDDVDPATDTVVGIVKTEGLTQTTLEKFTLSNGDVVEWGIWNASDNHSAQTYHNTESGAQTGTIDQPFYYVLADSTTAQLSGERSFSSGECSSGCFSSNLPTGTSFSGDLNVNFSDLSAQGNLTFIEPSSNQWSIQYEGVIIGTQMVGLIGGESAYLVDQSQNSYALTGGVYGIFSGPDDDLVFVGGVNASIADPLTTQDAQTVSTDELYGVYLLTEGEGVN
ncbi:FecR family protein [Saccharospirillum mangrovi]|uniref:FecR family protein n=1 Tax=Saccharospirillum mangrovi TaxID=2161747 RepID=UPI000D34BD00|nr:FecR domain-containing protein [Saccharospirillum mangrovi]